MEIDEDQRQICCDPKIDRKTRAPIIRWMTGSVARHQTCAKCGDSLSRIHAVDCSGAKEELVKIYGSLPDSFGRTIIDKLLNRFRNRQKSPKALYSNIANAIGMIYKDCLGFIQAPNGQWMDPSIDDLYDEEKGTRKEASRDKLPNIFKRNRGNRIG